MSPPRIYRSLREFMDLTGTTQEELAAAAKISQPHLSNILSGRRVPSVQTLFTLAEVGNVPVEAVRDLYRGKPRKQVYRRTRRELLAARHGLDRPTEKVG